MLDTDHAHAIYLKQLYTTKLERCNLYHGVIPFSLFGWSHCCLQADSLTKLLSLPLHPPYKNCWHDPDALS